MLQQLPTTNVATIQRALDLYHQGRGPHLLGSFLGKDFIELVAIRQGSGKCTWKDNLPSVTRTSGVR